MIKTGCCIKTPHAILWAFLMTLFFSSSAYCNGIEFQLTLSGKLMLGVAYRHQIDANTALRLGSFMGVAGAPVGFQFEIVQDLNPAKKWTPIFGVGVDAIVFKKEEKFSRRIYPGAVVGFSYCPQVNLRHSGELWLGWIANSLQPVGLNYLYFTKID